MNGGAGGGAGTEEDPADALARHVAAHPATTRYRVAFSGGRDSHVLLHAAAALLGGRDGIELAAVHVDHGLAHDSPRWAAHCADVATRLGVPIELRRARVEAGGDGPEAAARRARHAAFAEVIRPGEHLLLAHHAADQAETFLLQALRGSGPDGLAAMPRVRPFGGGVLARPLIGCAPDAIAGYGARHALEWIEDPSNADPRFDRNFLRLQVLPLLESRWPAANRTLGRAAAHSAAASRTLRGLAAEDLGRLCPDGGAELPVAALAALPSERARDALRLWVRRAGGRPPRCHDLARVLDELLPSRPDARGVVEVGDHEFRSHAGRLHLLRATRAAAPFRYEWRPPWNDLALPEAGLVLSRAACLGQGLRLPENAAITVRNRVGGERIELGDPAFRKSVKKLLQESRVPPWRRDRVPLLYVGERLAAVWGIAVATGFRCSGAMPVEGEGADPDVAGISTP